MTQIAEKILSDAMQLDESKRAELAAKLMMKLIANRPVILEQGAENLDWAAWCPELPGCTSAGRTETEALENIREAIELYLESDDVAPISFSGSSTGRAGA